MRTYGQYKMPENKYHCIEPVREGRYEHQCFNKRGHGPDGLYCWQHSKRHPAADAQIRDIS